MNNSPKVVLHIGYTKAASSTLKIHLFNKHPEINYLNVSDHAPLVDFWENIGKLNENEYKFSNNQEIYFDWIQPRLEKTKVNLLSHETVLDSRFSDNYLKAYRLKNLIPDAKIMIVVRHQVDILRSLYDMRPNNPLASEFKDKKITFEKWVDMSLHPYYFSRSFMSGIKYCENIDLYAQLFGQENLGIFLFEDLTINPDLFSEKLSEFLEVDSVTTKQLIFNSRQEHTAIDNKYYQIRSNFMPKFALSKLIPQSTYKTLKKIAMISLENFYKKTEISEKYQEKIGDIYKDSNQNLIEKYGIDLEKYNYPL
ncbi:MAG TPA: sulfotransferase domain-containing protein [Candidatus Obscuribacterales bacterium]